MELFFWLSPLPSQILGQSPRAAPRTWSTLHSLYPRTCLVQQNQDTRDRLRADTSS